MPEFDSTTSTFMTALRQGIPFVQAGPTVFQRTAGTDMQSRLHVPGYGFAAAVVSIRDGSGCTSDNLMSIPDAGPCKNKDRKIIYERKGFLNTTKV
jgi:hypothetical protein